MKKLLLSLAVAVMGAFATSAATYEIYAGGEETWTATEDGFTTTVTVDGKSFTLTTAKASSTSTLKDPGTTNAIRVFKGSDLTISSTDFEFNNVFLTGEKSNYDQNPTVTEGWTLKTNTSDYTYLLTNATAQKTVTFNATGKQARIHKITVSDEEIVEEPSTVTSVKSVKETIALDTDSKVTVDYELTVGWVNGSNIFACDKAGDFIQLYGSNSVKVGDVIPAGWEATYKFYNDVTPELVDFTLPATTEGTFTPKEVAAADITVAMVNSVVMVKNVVLAEASPATKDNFTGKVGDVELSLRNNYTLESVPAGTYDITLVVTVYNGEPSLYVTNFTAAAGLDSVMVDADAPVEYFNLQGIRVENPENGVFIRRQGTTVTKVVM